MTFDAARRPALVVDAVSHSYGSVLALDQVSLSVTAGQRVGVVGRNGAGKTTLLQTMAGWERPKAGAVRGIPAAVTVGYLPQESDGLGAETLAEYLARRSGIAAAEARVQRAAEALSAGQAASEEYQQALNRLVALGVEDFPARCARVATAVGLGAGALDRGMEGLSGGELARARLAAVLLSRHDFLLLDEPTNDLDFTGQDQLNELVATTQAGLVVVSHDRAFLERTVTEVVELDHLSHQATVYPGGYSDYLHQQQRHRELQYEQHEQYVAERDRITGMMRRQQEWARKGAARAVSRAPDNNKAARHGRRERAEGLAQGVRSLQKRLDRLEPVEQPHEGWQLRYSITTAGRSGELVARLRGACRQHGDFRLGPVDLDITWGDRIALLGSNGSGKSTLLSLLLGTTQHDAGTVQRGASTVVGSLDQHRTVFRSERCLLAQVERATGWSAQDVRTLLAKFDLTAQDLDRPAASLSPGEHTRAELALLMANGVNLLVLDEPTNHLDLPAVEQLQAALEHYPGTLVLVTHDRALLDGVRTTRHLQLSTASHDGTRTAYLHEPH